MLLALVRTEPRTASELLAELERLFGPAYRPSPGGVYPALNALVAERLLSVEANGRAKQYALTKLGREALDRRSRQLAAIQARTAVDLEADASIRIALEELNDAVEKRAGDADTDALCAALVRVTKEILAMASTNTGATHGKRR